MSGSCHEPAVAVEAPRAPAVAHRIALAGNPNVGKTTLFNLLTGLHQKVANYPGVTVERKSGRLVGHESIEVVDLPGTYSLNPRSIETPPPRAGARRGRVRGGCHEPGA